MELVIDEFISDEKISWISYRDTTTIFELFRKANGRESRVQKKKWFSLLPDSEDKAVWKKVAVE